MFEHQAFLNYAQGGSGLELQIAGMVVVGMVVVVVVGMVEVMVMVVMVIVKGKQMNVMLKDGS